MESALAVKIKQKNIVPKKSVTVQIVLPGYMSPFEPTC
jgi:hypothetical protein